MIPNHAAIIDNVAAVTIHPIWVFTMNHNRCSNEGGGEGVVDEFALSSLPLVSVLWFDELSLEGSVSFVVPPSIFSSVSLLTASDEER